MTISTYLSAMLSEDEYQRMMSGFTSPVFFNDADRALFEHYKQWFIVLRVSGLMADLDYVEVVSRPRRTHSR